MVSAVLYHFSLMNVAFKFSVQSSELSEIAVSTHEMKNIEDYTVIVVD